MFSTSIPPSLKVPADYVNQVTSEAELTLVDHQAIAGGKNLRGNELNVNEQRDAEKVMLPPNFLNDMLRFLHHTRYLDTCLSSLVQIIWYVPSMCQL